MTATLTTPAAVSTADSGLQRLLRWDAVATGLAGLVAVAAPASTWGDVPGWLPRAVGVVLLVVAADLAVASRWTGRRLRIATTVCAELALAWVAATVAVLVLHDTPPLGTELLAVVGLVTLAFGVSELRALRRS